MKKSTNIASIILFAVSVFFIFYYSFNDNLTACFIFALLMLAIGVVRFVLLSRQRYLDEKKFIPLRNVTTLKAIEENNGKETSGVLLVHVDDACKDKCVIKVFKDYVPLVDVTHKVNK